jgi:hypothetical protein
VGDQAEEENGPFSRLNLSLILAVMKENCVIISKKAAKQVILN